MRAGIVKCSFLGSRPVPAKRGLTPVGRYYMSVYITGSDDGAGS